MTSAETTTTAAPIKQQQQQQQMPAQPYQQQQMPARVTLDPMQVGWQFVQEYYSILNKSPARLHCFYNTQSVMLHGVEAESVTKCVGQAEIHARFVELDLNQAQVLVSNVDCQASLAGGILVCVLGELEKRGSVARKFTQTFLLAEQPTGYYVHNDVFRFLKEDDLSEDEQEFNGTEADSTAATMDDSTVKSEISATDNAPMFSGGPVEQATPALAHSVEPVVKTTPAPPSVVENGHSQPKSQKQQQSQQQQQQQEKPVAAPKKVADTKPQSPAVKPKEAPAKSKQSAPATPKTWATLAENGKENWGQHAASEVKAAVVSPSRQESAPNDRKSNVPRSSTGNGPSSGPSGKPHHETGGRSQVQRGGGYTDTAVYVRGFTRTTTIQHIKDGIGRAVGFVRWVELTSETSALVEFSELAHVKRAIEMGKATVNAMTVIIEDKEKSGRPRTQPQSGRHQSNNGSSSTINSVSNNTNINTGSNKNNFSGQKKATAGNNKGAN